MIPLLLAGPILRRAEPSRVCIWLATSQPVRTRARLFAVGDAGADLRRLGAGEGQSARLGDRLHVHLIEVVPDHEGFPGDVLLAYDVELAGQEGDGQVRDLDGLGLLGGPHRIAYGDLPLPTFFLRERLAVLHVLHGSCRLLHGKGEDAFWSADQVLDRQARHLAERPSALFLTGDQIYGDEVAGPLVRHLTRLGCDLLGEEDETSVPGMPRLSEIPLYGRGTLVAQRAGFTSGEQANHLMSLGEFVAVYLTAWNEATWPPRFPSAGEAYPPERGRPRHAARQRRQYVGELEDLERARLAIPAVRRVLANVPTYMIFDDHDVTDDWNLTAAWRERVRASPAGRRIVANALASFWAFQGWGNDPEAYDEDFKAAITAYCAADRTTGGEAFDAALWSFDRWSFHAPTDPPTVLLDTRTQRSYDSPEGAARLMSASERERVRQLARRAGHAPGRPLILVSAVPVFGLELQERRQKFLVGKLGPYEIDFEAWHSNLAGLVDFAGLLVDDLGLAACVILSGDVHYGMNVQASFAVGDRQVDVAQLVSSSYKHSGAWSRVALDWLGTLVSKRHERVGWTRPPRPARTTGWKERLMSRPANTDEWDDDSPVFLSSRRARHLRMGRPADYREVRTYVLPSESASVLIGENNVGLMSLRGGDVVHRLLGQGTVVHTAHLRAGPPGP